MKDINYAKVVRSSLRILYLEDDMNDVELVQAKLEEEGLTCDMTHVETQADFVAALDNGGFDIILADYKLPSFDGISALAIAREKTPDVPFIFLSGAMGEELAIETLKNGATDYVLKQRLSRLVPAIKRVLKEAEEHLERKKAEEALRRIEWLLKKKPAVDNSEVKQDFGQPYGNLSKLNTARLILDSVGEEVLSDIVSDYLYLLETSSAIYEKNGDYAVGIFSSGWCRFLDYSSRKLCRTADNREALQSGLWHCHESCWNEASRISIKTGKPVDIECRGGLHLYAVPIFAGSEIIGSINFGYGDPPKDIEKLKEIALRYGVSVEELRMHSSSHESRPFFITELAKNRLLASARIIGEIVNRRRAEKELEKQHERLEEVIEERTSELKETNEKLQLEIMERQRAEEELRKSEEKYRTVADFAYDWEDWMDPSGRYIYVSPSAEWITGYQRDEFLDSDQVIKITHPDDRELVKKHFQEILSGSIEIHCMDFRIITRSGDVRWISHYCQPVYEKDGRFLGRRGSSRDITERKKAETELRQMSEELKRSNSDLLQFAYAASHDLKAPLRNIEGFIKLFARRYAGKIDEKANEIIAFIVEGAKGMQALISDLLEYAKVGTKEKRFRRVNSSLALAKAVASLRMVVEESNAEITWNEPLPTITADASQVTSLFQNLIENAIKYRSTEPPRVHISAEPKVNEWAFSVHDNGIGIPPEDCERIFGVFQRLHSTAEYPGTGIGLAICKRIVERHGGRIWVESEPGKGSIFYFTILSQNEEDVDRRSENRVKYHENIHFLHRGEKIGARTMDISSKGLSVDMPSDTLIASGDILDIFFKDSRKIQARVIWVNKLQSKSKLGLQMLH